MGWPCFSVVARVTVRAEVKLERPQRARTNKLDAGEGRGSLVHRAAGRDGLAHRAHLLGFLEQDNGGVCVPAPSLIWELEPATGQVRRQDAGLGTGCARPRSLWRPPAARPWRQARCGRRPRHICCAVGRARIGSSSQLRPPRATAGRGPGRGRRRRARSGCGGPGGRACGPPSGRPGCHPPAS